MTFAQIKSNINALWALYNTIKCWLKLVFTSSGTLHTASSPDGAASDRSIPFGAIFYFDGTDGAFPEGQAWVKTYEL